MVEDAVFPDDFADVAASTNDNETSDSYSCETDQSDREPSNENWVGGVWLHQWDRQTVCDTVILTESYRYQKNKVMVIPL